MKKLFFASILFFVFVTLTTAQTTSKTLQGTWKIEGIETSGVYFELSTGKITLDPSLTSEEPVSPDELAMMADIMKEQLAPYYSNFIQFNNDKISISYGGKNAEGTYKIKEKEGHQYLETTYTDGTVKEIEFTIKDKNLSIIRTGAENLKMIFKLS